MSTIHAAVVNPTHATKEPSYRTKNYKPIYI